MIKKDKKKIISSSMAADVHQPFKRPKASSSSMPTQSMAWGRWEGLPNDVLSLILQKLILQDHLRLSCVCVPWNLAVRGPGGLGYRPSPKPQLPWLMVAGAGRDCTSAKFISFSQQRTYDIPLPHPPIRERICVGSSHGWLITVHNHNLAEMHLLNPITGVQVPLPAITTTIAAAAADATTYPSGYIKIHSPRKSGLFFGKAILSSAPSRDGTGDFTIFLIRGMPRKRRRLAIARIGDDAWTTFGDEFIVDIIYHNGQLHCMGVSGFINIWEQQQHDHHLSFVPRFTIDTRDFHHNNIPLKLAYNKTICGPYKHFVQSTTGELFMLARSGNPRRFLITRLDLDRNEYEPVDDLKDLVFFVGINDSIVVSATKFPEVKRNRVYFTEYNYIVSIDLKFCVQPSIKLKRDIFSPSNSSPSCDIGVYDVEKEEQAELLDNIASHLSWEEKKHIGSLLNWPPATWFTPTAF